MSRAVVTIVSKNYLSQARVLADGLKATDPDVRVFCALVDRVDGVFDPAKEPFEVIPLAHLGLPSGEDFAYRYSILELNTAVKPFALRHVLDSNPDIDRICYMDPDMVVYQPLAAVWTALETNDVALIPHLRRPFHDRANPRELGILQSGTYNLGFIGLRRGADCDRLLEWWSEKLYLDCVVDIPNGLFTDQKWMDLVPGYHERVAIVRHPGYDVAYWNLHERPLAMKDGVCLADGLPLAFFHFSGYSPLTPGRLSKHQTRHDLRDLPVVRTLCDDYADRLAARGFHTARRWAFSYGKLANGIPVPAHAHWAIRHCIERGIPFPSPSREADAFCRWLMTPNARMPGGCIPPIAAVILARRTDVAAAYPQAGWNHLDAGFVAWIRGNGGSEEGIESLVERFWSCWDAPHPITRAAAVLTKRTDLLRHYPNLASDAESLRGFVDWITAFGAKEEGLDAPAVAAAVTAHAGGYRRVLEFYFTRLDLQKAFPQPHLAECRKSFVHWLIGELGAQRGFDEGDVRWFAAVADLDPNHLLLVNAAYNQHLRIQTGAQLTLFDLARFIPHLAPDGNRRTIATVAAWLTSVDGPPPLQQLEAHWVADQGLQAAHPDAFADRAGVQRLFDVVAERMDALPVKGSDDWSSRLAESVRTFDGSRKGITLAGYLHSPTGMGQSARALLAILRASGTEPSCVVLPTLSSDPPEAKTPTVRLFGWPGAGDRTVIIDANADAAPDALRIMPAAAMHGRRRIAYWVWETEELPASQAANANAFHEIWTPSRFSAEAIARHCTVPVKVVPHSLDFEAIDAALARPDRNEFRLPKDKLLIGYSYDARSSLERKNPLALVRAFRSAFRDDANVKLVFKVHGIVAGAWDWERLLGEIAGGDVILIDRTLDRGATLRLMACFDAYASLHRAEGFGLTMAEAMALGKPVVASAYSGNMDFMDDQTALLVPVKRIVTDRAHGPYPAGTIWGDPDHGHAVEALRQVGDMTKRKQFGSKAREAIRNILGPKVLGESVKTMLGGQLTSERGGATVTKA